MARPLLRRLGRAFGLILLAAVSIYTVALVTVLVVSQQDQRRAVDAIVVLGAAQYNGRPSPVLRARLDHALRLYNEGYAPRIVVTGGVGRGDTTSEAIVGRHYLLARDVVPGDVVVQPQGRSTQASMTAVADWLDAEGLHSVLLVSDPFHMYRLRLEARRTNLEAYTSPTESSPISDNPVVELRYLAAEGFKIPVAWVRATLSPSTSHPHVP
ncbi:MAG TPA: YdcF family protein [Gemmatimonadales bacterium]|nr:YdcF family protein [Gemmatimonadales bacterium]